VFGPVTIIGHQVIGETLAFALVSGDNTFTVPQGATACWIQGPVNGSATLTLRTNQNQLDVGLPINGLGLPTIYPFPSSQPSTMTINASADQTAPLTVIFI